MQNLEMQSHFLLLWEKDIKPTEKFLDADPLFEKVRDEWGDFQEEFNFTRTEFLSAFAKASSGKGFDKEQAPAIGQIAKALGNITDDVKNAILTAQAAVRAEQVLDDANDYSIDPKTAEEIERQHSRIDYKAQYDPHQLVRSQIANKDADELNLKIKSGGFETVEEIFKEHNALSDRVKMAYRDAEFLFRGLDIPAAKLIAQELSRAAQDMGKQR